MSKVNTNKFLQSLVTLTKERDAFELNLTLKLVLSDLVKAVGQVNEVKSVNIYGLKDISKLFFSVLSGENQEMSPDLCQKLLECYNTGQHCVYQPEIGDTYHMFPLKHDVAHYHSVVAVQAQIKNQNIYDSICKLLDVYQNYLALLNDNERDTLTGLLNRKTFDHKINKILSNLHQKNLRKNDRYVEAYYLAIFDIDHFKKVNDQFGHLIGDEVLLLLSQLMAKTFRETDPLFRFGGEEFIGIFGCANEGDIKLVLDRFVKKLQEFNFPQVGQVTASIGCAKLSVDTTPTQLVDRADLALYYAKNNGRNRICYYEELIAAGLLKDEAKVGEIELF